MVDTVTRSGALVLLLSAVACTTELPGNADSGVATVTAVYALAGLDIGGEEIPSARDAPVLPVTVDAVPVGRVPVVPVPVAPVPATLVRNRQVWRDTTPVTATPDELRQLRSALGMPVADLRARDLRDSYAETRGGRVHEAIDIAAARGTPSLLSRARPGCLPALPIPDDTELAHPSRGRAD